MRAGGDFITKTSGAKNGGELQVMAASATFGKTQGKKQEKSKKRPNGWRGVLLGKGTARMGVSLPKSSAATTHDLKVTDNELRRCHTNVTE